MPIPGSRTRFVIAVCVYAAMTASAQVSVLTQHNDNGRTGQNLNETVLTTSNVNVSNFGKLFALTVDGYIYAQPLYMPAVTIKGNLHNVVFVATENNSVYAFDADNGSTPTLWTVNLGPAVPSSDICNPPVSGCPYNDLTPLIGVTATPVIDPSTGTLYVVAYNKDSNATYHYRLHAIDVTSGVEKFGGPVEVTTSGFNPFYQLNRPGLLLLNGTVYVGFGSKGDFFTWHGYVMGYNAQTLTQTAVADTTPKGNGGGVWGGGTGLLADTDSIYVSTSNGTFDFNTGGSDYASSVLKLSTSQSLALTDFFAPSDQSFLNGSNADLGAGGPILLPATNIIVGGGKDGILRVMNTGSMGEFNAVTNNNLQNFQAANAYPNGMIMGAPVYWNSPSFGPVIYLWGPSDVIKAWKFTGTTFQTTPASQGTLTSPAGESDLAALAVSANGNQAGTGVVWAARAFTGNPNEQTQPGILYAFDASDLTHELWDSKQNPARDDVGNYAKFAAPTIANGKVYLATFSNQLLVYGLNPPPPTGINFIQVAAATPQSSQTSVAATYPSAQVQGDLNIVVVGWNDTTSSVQSVKDSAGNTYALAIGPTSGTGLRQSIYYAKSIAGGSNTVTVAFTQAAVYPDVRILEYSGLDTANPLDVNAGTSGNSATASSGTATTTFANDLIFGANTVATGNKSAASGFTARIITTPDSDLAEDEVVATAGSYSATAPLTAAGPWVMQMAAFKALNSSPNPPTVLSVSPSSGSINGGTSVTINGTNFTSGATVTFGGNAATNVAFVSSTTLTGTTPAHNAGAVSVVVTNPNQQSGTLANGFTYTSGVATIKFVQVAAATPQSSISTVTVPYTQIQTLGNLNLVAIGWNDTTSSIQSVTDSLGNIYTLAVGPTAGTALQQSIYYAKNIKAGSNTVTVKFNQAASFPDVRVLEYSGLDTTSPLDASAGSSGKSATASTGPVTTKFASELILGADIVWTGNKAPGSGFTARIITSPDSDLAEDRIVTATGSYSASATLTASGPWVMQLATFKAAGQ